MNKHLNQAIKIAKQGGIIIFPTDTAFGIGCRIDREDSVKKLFKLRMRSNEKASPVLVSSIQMAEDYVNEIGTDVKKLMEKYWPGGLTIVLNCNLKKVQSLPRGGGSTIGVRMPKHSTTLSMIKQVGIPILGSSANFSGGQTPYRMSDLDPELVKLVDYVLPGKCSVKRASTVIDCTKKPWKILREGAVIVRS